MKSKLEVALLASLISLSACKMQQDPIAGAPEAIREGRPPSAEKPVQEKPLDKNALQIDAPILVNGRVGSPVELNITGRVMTPGINFQMSIDNLEDFPGASFDAKTGDFKWIPSKKIMGGFPSVDLALRVTMATVPTAEFPTVSIERKTVILVIANSYSKPIINQVTGPSPVLTGARHIYNFQMEDVDAIGDKDVSVEVRDCDSGYATSIAHLVTVRRIDTDNTAPNKYKGDLVLDLASATNLNSGYYCFGLMAISKHGVVSDVYKTDFSIESKMRSTRITLDRDLQMTVGEKARLAFAIYDPSGVGSLSVKSMDDVSKMLPGSTLSCSASYSTKYQLDCSGLIDATAAPARTYTLNFSIDNSGARATQKTNTNHVLRIQVKAATP